jgi:hypothetical protein
MENRLFAISLDDLRSVIHDEVLEAMAEYFKKPNEEKLLTISYGTGTKKAISRKHTLVESPATRKVKCWPSLTEERESNEKPRCLK